MSVLGSRRIADHKATAAAAKEQPGHWVPVGVYDTWVSGRAVVRSIHGGRHLLAYAPMDSFQAYAFRIAEGTAVWTRYVAGLDVPELPETMTVRVRYDGDQRGYEGVGILTVAIGTRCPRCGGPRGAGTVRPHRFRADGETFTVDIWDNPCGHRDLYEDVVHEARQMTAPAPLRAIPDPARLLLEAADQKRVHHARQGAQLLVQHGYPSEAAAIVSELKARRGHMSARQAAAFLTGLATSTTDSTSAKDNRS